MHPFLGVLTADERLVAGLMSGTSLDGIDAVVVRLVGHGPDLQYELLSFVSIPYDRGLAELIRRNSEAATSSVRDLTLLNVHLAHCYADAVRQAMAAAGLPLDALDLIGCHGQTVHHVPMPETVTGAPIRATLQIGDGSTLANLLGVPVVSDFRTADMALGGQGAPLVPYLDYVALRSATHTRALLNIGGIANITVLPAGCSAAAVEAFDTGPGNMIMDALAQRLFGVSYDEGGRLAAAGTPDTALLAYLMERDDFLPQSPPKSTGREAYGEAWIEAFLNPELTPGRTLTPQDYLATATAFTAYMVYGAYSRFIRNRYPLHELLVSGGGVHNLYLMQLLANAFSPVPVQPMDAIGMNPDAKEALCFAILAHETASGIPSSLPAVTGARRPALLGKLSFPSP